VAAVGCAANVVAAAGWVLLVSAILDEAKDIQAGSAGLSLAETLYFCSI
jgi:hypothetical protein